MRKTKKILGLSLTIWVMLIIGAGAVLGALIFYHWNYDASQTGEIDIAGGSASEGTIVLIDGVQLTNSGDTIDMDVTTLNPCDDLSYQHTIESTNFYWSAMAELTLPDNSDPASDWYGVNILIDGANSKSWILEPGVQELWNTTYTIDCDFIDPGILYPFQLNVTVWNDLPVLPDFNFEVAGDNTWYEMAVVWSDTEQPYAEGTFCIDRIDMIDFDNSNNDLKIGASCDYVKCRIIDPADPLGNYGKTASVVMTDGAREFSGIVTIVAP